MRAIVWKSREKLLQRGMCIMEAHHRNRILDTNILHVWFMRHYHEYAAFRSFPNRSPRDFREELQRVESRFWSDVCKRLGEMK